jgi:uncharacterized lipoprotein YbaY
VRTYPGAEHEKNVQMKRVLLAGTVAALCVVIVAWHAANALPPSGRESQAMPGAQIVSGTVSYRERAELPQTALVHVELIDVSQKDPRKATLGEETIWPAGIKLPVTFRIPYDPSRIDLGHLYVVRARIVDGEKTLFVSSSMTYVLTKGARANVDIVVVPVSIRY